MSDEGAYVPQPSDTVVFDHPLPDGGKRRLFQVQDHDAQTGVTRLAGFSRSLSAREMADLGAKRVQVVSPGDLVPDWAGAGRRLSREGAGDRPKIYQLAFSRLGGHCMMAQADEQAALALAQRAADQTGEPVLLARIDSGELVIGSPDAVEAVGDGLGMHVMLSVQPGLSGSGGSITLRQASELLGDGRAHEAVAAALTSALDVPASLGDAAAEAVLQAIAGLLPTVKETRLSFPGWQDRVELTPATASMQAGPDLSSLRPCLARPSP